MNQIVLSIILLCAFVNNVISEMTDVNWMSFVNDDLKLNQINIPGTHDSTTYGITVTDENNNNIYRTQNKSIKDQLNIGVRYFDIRMAWNPVGQVHIVHDVAECKDENGENIFLKDILDNCSEFLNENKSETVILHLKLEDSNKLNHEFIKNQVNEYISDYIKNDKMYNTELPENKTRMPKLEEARSKIVIVTRRPEYNGIHISLNDKAEDVQYDIKKCDFNNDYECRIQDGYNLPMEGKWEAIQKLIADQKLIDQGDVLGENVLAINFMSTTVGNLEEVANTLNNRLIKEESENAILVPGKQYGWILVDFVDENVTRYIYKSNIMGTQNENYSSAGYNKIKFSVYLIMMKRMIEVVKVLLRSI